MIPSGVSEIKSSYLGKFHIETRWRGGEREGGGRESGRDRERERERGEIERERERERETETNMYIYANVFASYAIQKVLVAL